jgi:adenylyltransferase/sulfurtransferase
MRQRVDVDETLPPVVMPAPILHELYRHALETQPEECCGLILGTAAERYQDLVRCRNEMTQRHQKDPLRYPRDGHEAFYMTESDYVRAMEKAKEDGREITAVYHSHVGSGVYLSEMDLEYAASPLFPFPDADHIVVSLVEGKVGGVGLFRRGASPGLFTGSAVEPPTP